MTATRMASEVRFPYGLVLPYAGRIRSEDTSELKKHGWYLCDGSEVSRELPGFEVIGTIYGVGDQTNTFNVPDYRGRFLRGVDNPTGSNSAGRDPDSDGRYGTNGGAKGTEVGSVQEDAYQEHQHALASVKSAGHQPAVGHPHGYKEGEYGFSISATEGSTGRITNETRPKNSYINYIVFLGR
ncbi:phage tail protein [Mesorhizobium sp. Z1-4]|uniref:phage tail protein n=1 Tax=Mesorhizobium sp. Z1-4 TaxID=2448478 RepID=UPI000FDBD276|nr:phage tail protein [Mesorhizobium sp. Z1-4]